MTSRSVWSEVSMIRSGVSNPDFFKTVDQQMKISIFQKQQSPAHDMYLMDDSPVAALVPPSLDLEIKTRLLLTFRNLLGALHEYIIYKIRNTLLIMSTCCFNYAEKNETQEVKNKKND